MHCEFLYREHHKPRWISTLNQKHLFVKHLLDHNLYIEYIFISTAKQWNQEQNSAKHKLGKHQRVHRRKIRRSGGLFLLCWLQSFMRRCSIKFQSWVQRIDKGFVHSLHQVIITSLLEDKQRSSMGGGGVSALCCQWFWGAKRKKEKKEEERKNEWWWKAPRFL